MLLPRLGLLAGLALALALPLACGGPTFIVQQYDGPIRQRETIAVIRVRGADSVLVVGVDAQPTGAAVDSDARLHIEVLPGEHSIDAGIVGEPARRVWFNAAPGKVYRAVWQAGQPRVFEVDDSSDALDQACGGNGHDGPPRKSFGPVTVEAGTGFD